MRSGGRADRRAGGRIVAIAILLSAFPVLRTAAQCPDGSPPPCRQPGVSLDTARFVILPFAHREGSERSELDGADCAELLYEAFERWSDVHLADKPRVYDALSRRGVRVPFRIAFATGLAVARELGAGKLVMGQEWQFADTLHLSATVYDVPRAASLQSVSTRMTPNVREIGKAFNVMAASLLVPGLQTESEGAGAELTRSLTARNAYNMGQKAVRAWDLTAAARYYRSAIASDSEFAHAYLSLSQVLLWAADSSAEAMRDRIVIARRTDSLLVKLSATDRTLLLAQQAMFDRRWPEACRHYREALQADSSSFDAWYGLAECNAGDPVVIRDPRDTTRFVFRGSYHTAVLAYRKALLLAPSFNFTFQGRAAARLPRMLVAEGYLWRQGQHNGVTYVAFPGLDADTLAYYAAPIAVAAHQNIRPPTHAAALAKNRRIVVEVTAAWVDAFPREPQAHHALAHALEVNGNIAPTTASPRSALSETAAAQRLERRAGERVQDAVDAVRLLVKAGEFDAARRSGDSLLRVTPRPTAGVAGVAVLLGRPALATRFLAPEDTAWLPAGASNQPVSFPLQAAQAGLALLAYAAVGAPRESIAVFERRIEDLVAGLPASRRAAARSALLDVSAELVFDVMGLRPAHRSPPSEPDWRMAMQWALAQGDSTLVRASLDTLLKEFGRPPTSEEASSEGVYIDARLYLALGDTASAERYLDGTLDNLPGVYSALLRFLPLAGSLVRMMALRGELAAARGENRTARRWASAVIALWLGSEPALQPTVARMKHIVQTTK